MSDRQMHSSEQAVEGSKTKQVVAGVGCLVAAAVALSIVMIIHDDPGMSIIGAVFLLLVTIVSATVGLALLFTSLSQEDSRDEAWQPPEYLN